MGNTGKEPNRNTTQDRDTLNHETRFDQGNMTSFITHQISLSEARDIRLAYQRRVVIAYQTKHEWGEGAI